MDAPFYTARHGIVWLNDTLPHTVKAAEAELRDLRELTITELDPIWSAEWARHLAPLAEAIRQAKEQEQAVPVEQKEAA